VSGSRVQAWPRAFSERAELFRQLEELFYGAAEELDEQQMVERVLGVFQRAHQP
jgi:hypothetical protein